MTDGELLKWSGNSILNHTGTSTLIGDNSSSAVVTISGGNTTFGGNVGVGVAPITSPNSADRSLSVYSGQDCSVILKDNVTTWEMYMNDDLLFSHGASPTTVMTLTDDANVGIGTASPATKLHVYSATADAQGVLYVEQNPATNDPTMVIQHNTAGGNANSNQGLVIKSAGTGAGNGNIFHAYKEDGSSTAVVMKGGGNVGISCNPLDFHADADDLVVGGGSGNTGITIHSGTSGYGSIFFADGTADDATEKRGQIRYLQGTERMDFITDNVTTAALSISATGTGTFSGDVVAYSDKKLKKNIKTLDGSKVYDMRGVSFDRKDTGKHSSGVIAQEIQKIAPELITKGTDDILGVAYGNLTGYLIEAIKDLKVEIEELKKCNKCENCNCENK